MNTNMFFDMLSAAPYGAYAVDLNQIIMFWNHSAERILGHTSNQVIGRRCYDVLQGLAEEGSPPVCLKGCPSIRYARTGRSASVVHVRMLCSSGHRKQVTITPLLVPDAETKQVMLVHLFYESMIDSRPKGVAVLGNLFEERLLSATPTNLAAGVAHRPNSPLTAREVEIVRLVTQGLGDEQIAAQLNLSLHTVRNHLRHVREKLHARNRLAIVLAAQSQGVI